MRLKKEEILKQLQIRHPDYKMKEIADVYDSLFDVIMESVADGDSVLIVGFGRFENKLVKPRVARNLKTGELINLPSQRHPKFKAGRKFDQLVNGK